MKNLFKRILACALSTIMVAGSAIAVSAVAPNPQIEEEMLTGIQAEKQLTLTALTNLYGEGGMLRENSPFWDRPDVEPGIAALEWGSTHNPDNNNISTHDYIINEANTSTDNPIPSKYLSMVKNICMFCDTHHGANGTSNLCRAFHAGDNYVGTLKVLWEFAHLIAANHVPHPELTDAQRDAALETEITSIVNTIKAGIPSDKLYESGNTVKEQYHVLFYTMKKMVKDYYKGVSGTQTETGRCKFIVYGMIMHLLGDLTAHKFAVPARAVALMNGTETTCVASKHFENKVVILPKFNIIFCATIQR